jgi:integrase
MRRRQYGTGSVYQRKSDGRWCGTFDAGYTRTGGRRRLTVTAATEADAKRRLKLRIRDFEQGQTSTSTRTTVRAWAAEWLAITVTQVTPNTHTTDRGAVSAWIVPTIGHKRLAQLTPGDVRAVRKAVTDAGRSTSTALRYHGVLMRLLKAAADAGHPIPGPVLAVAPPGASVTGREPLALPEALAVLAVASGLPHGSRWVAALLQGMRQGEALGLTWAEVDLSPEDPRIAVSWQLQPLPYLDKHDRGRGFRVPDGYEARQLVRSLHLVRPKSKAGWRVIPLVPPMAEALRRWREVCPASPHDLVWPALDGSPADENADRTEWEAQQQAAGVWHPSGDRFYTGHEARHTTATLLMQMRVPETVRTAILGHSSMASTRAYEHADVAEVRRALAGLAERLELGQ